MNRFRSDEPINVADLRSGETAGSRGSVFRLIFLFGLFCFWPLLLSDSVLWDSTIIHYSITTGDFDIIRDWLLSERHPQRAYISWAGHATSEDNQSNRENRQLNAWHDYIAYCHTFPFTAEGKFKELAKYNLDLLSPLDDDQVVAIHDIFYDEWDQRERQSEQMQTITRSNPSVYVFSTPDQNFNFLDQTINDQLKEFLRSNEEKEMWVRDRNKRNKINLSRKRYLKKYPEDEAYPDIMRLSFKEFYKEEEVFSNANFEELTRKYPLKNYNLKSSTKKIKKEFPSPIECLDL